MSYSVVQPGYYGGFGAAQPAPYPAPRLPALSTLLPSQSQVASDLAPYIDIANAVSPPPGFDPTNPDTWKPELMIPYGMRMVQELQKQMGIQKLDVSQITAIVKGDLKWLDDLGIPLTTIPTNVRDTCILFARCSAVAACKQLGIPPEIGTATVDALSDGEFTDKDVEAIGGVAGAMGGSAICSLIGIPPQIGGYFGGMIGGAIGSFVGDALSIGGGSAARAEQRRQRDRARDAVRKQLQTIRGQYQGMVPLVRSLYWTMFDHMLADLENFWEMTECTTGIKGVLPPVRFPLLWGTNGLVQNLAPGEDPFLRHAFDASRCPPIAYNLERDAGLCLASGYMPPGSSAGCPSMFGCPYPSFPGLGAGGAERVAQAFAAYNIDWVQPPNREQNTKAWQDAMPVPPSNIVNYIAGWTQRREGCKSNQCRREIDGYVGNAVGQYNDILSAALELAGPNHMLEVGMRIQSDIVGTGGVYAAAVALRAQKNAIRSGDTAHVRAVLDRIGNPKHVAALHRSVTLSRAYGATTNALLNFGLPALGAVLIGKAVLGRKG